MVDAFCSRHIVPLHHIPTVSEEPSEFPSYTLASAKSQALQGEVNKMLKKSILELVDHLGLGYYSQLFLVHKVMKGWRPVIDSLSLNGYITLTEFKIGDSPFGSGVDQERRLHVLNRPQGRLLPDTQSSGLLTLSLNHSRWQGLPVQGTVFQPFCSYPGLHQGVHSSFRVGSQEGDAIPDMFG